MNSYTALQTIKGKLGIAEGTENPHWSDQQILRELRLAYRFVWMKITQELDNWFGTSALVTPVAGLVTLPARCGKLIRIEEEATKTKIHPRGLHAGRDVLETYPSTLSTEQRYLEMYVFADTAQILQTDYAKQVRVFYERRLALPICGTADTGSTTDRIVLRTASEPSRVDDYYNDLTFEVFENTGEGTVATSTDYNGTTRGVTVTGSFGSNSVYGTEFETPEEADGLILIKATQACLVKPASHLKDEYYRLIRSEYTTEVETFESWLDSRVKDIRRIGD